MGFAHTWDINAPADVQPANLLGQDIRNLKQDTMQRIAAISDVFANRPTWETTSASVDWTGVLFFATDTGHIFRWSGTAWVDVTSDFIPTVSPLPDLPTLGGVVLAPTGALTLPIWRAPFACTVTNVRGFIVGATGSKVNAQKNGALSHLAADLTLGSAGAWLDGGAVQNTAYVAGDALALLITSVAGTPTSISIQVDFTRP